MRVNISYILLVLVGLAACSEKRSDVTPSVHRTAVIEIAERTPESRFAAYDEPISVGFDADARVAAEENESRAALGDDMRTVRWTDGDNVALWATNASGGGDIAGEIFRYYTQSAENAARFTGNMKVAADEYECVAVYPGPSRVEGRRVTYTLPAVQDGVYRSELDVMSSDPSSGKLVEVSGGGGVRLTMHHRCHALRIRVPEGKNRWGKPVTRLLVEFPREVAGDMSFDLPAAGSAGDITLTDGKRAIDLDLSAAPLDASANDAPQYVWVFIAAGPIEGEISFTPLFEDGYCAETLSASVDREFAAGRVTPINLAISGTEQPVTWFDFAVDHTQLGEPVNLLTVTAPENARFRGDMRSATVRASADGKFSVGYYAKFYPDAFAGARVDLSYDSTHAVVAGTATLPAAPVVDGRNALAVKAPYLFFEDFGGVASFNADDNHGSGSNATNPQAISLDTYGLSGWTGARVGASAGKAVRCCCHFEGAGLAYGRYDGRIDSAPIGCIRSGMTVNVKVTYDYDGGTTRTDKDTAPTYAYGYTTQSGGFGGNSDIEHQIESGIVLSKTNGYESIGQSKTFTIQGCSSAHRLSWKVSNNRSGWTFYFGDYYLYIDNIRVSIAQ